MSTSVGIALSGGGAFGAWEVGALLQFFGWWKAKFGSVPPVSVVSGTSTGALIAPFVLLAGTDDGYDYLTELLKFYTGVTSDDLRKLNTMVIPPYPAALYFLNAPAFYDAGYDDDPGKATLLYSKLLQALPAARATKLGTLWPGKRLAIATVDFVSGSSRVFTNDPATVALQNGGCLLQKGVFASAMAPLALPPAHIASDSGTHPYFDGGVSSETPLRELFSMASGDNATIPAINLTHVVSISSFPTFPSNDMRSEQKAKPFPASPAFADTGDRMNILMSEASASKDVALAAAAIRLRGLGISPEEVQKLTGHSIPGPAPEFVSLVPSSRLGWHAFTFKPSEMTAMVERGKTEAAATLEKWLP